MARPMRTIIMILLALFALIGLIILIIWLSFKPKKPVFAIKDALIQGLDIDNNNHLHSTFNFVIGTYNPNKKVSIYYDKAQVSVSYGNDMLAFHAIDPFFQPRRNETYLRATLVAKNVALSGTTPKDLGLEKAAGEVELNVRMKAKVRFKRRMWKSRHWNLKILCSRTFVLSSSSKSSQWTSCHTSL